MELQRISRLEDPIKMFEERKESHKKKYKDLKQKLSQMTCIDGKMVVAKSQNGTAELLESIFQRGRSQP